MDTQLAEVTELLRIMDARSDLDVGMLALREDSQGAVVVIHALRWPEFACMMVESLSKEGFRYAPPNEFFGIDGQPRVDFSGRAWITLHGEIDGIELILHIWSFCGGHRLAEYALARFYGLVQETMKLDPLSLFRLMIKTREVNHAT